MNFLDVVFFIYFFLIFSFSLCHFSEKCYGKLLTWQFCLSVTGKMILLTWVQSKRISLHAFCSMEKKFVCFNSSISWRSAHHKHSTLFFRPSHPSKVSSIMKSHLFALWSHHCSNHGCTGVTESWTQSRNTEEITAQRVSLIATFQLSPNPDRRDCSHTYFISPPSALSF